MRIKLSLPFSTATKVPTAKLPSAGMAPRRTYLHSSLAFMRAMKE